VGSAVFAPGIMPEVTDPLTLEASDTWVVEQLEKLKQTLQGAARHAPSLEEFYRNEVSGF